MMTDFKWVFIDTAPIIYYLEQNSFYVKKVQHFFEHCPNSKIQIVTSAITIEEYLVFPYVTGKMEFADNFKRFIKYMKIEIIPIDDKIAERAAEIRGQFKSFKAMDSLQIAAAIESRCDMFFTNDKQLRREKSLPCMTMDDL